MDDSSRSTNFRATQVEAFAALQEAARLTGMQHLSGDPSQGLVVFTAGRLLLASGPKVTAHIEQTGADTVGVTLSSDLKMGLLGTADADAWRDRMFDTLTGLLPAAE